MATVLFFGTDSRVSAILEPFFRTRNEDANEGHSVMVVADQKALDEALIAMAFDVIIVEQSKVSPSATEWLERQRLKKSSLKTTFVLYGEETDQMKVMKFIDSGFVDYIVSPPDRLLLIEKIFLYATGYPNRDMRQVYSLQMSESVDLAKPGFIEELSEFDCKVRSLHAPKQGDLMILYSSAFGGDTSKKNSVLARCYRTGEHSGFKGQFLSVYSFVGVTSDTLKQIRNALRKSYVSSKPKT